MDVRREWLATLLRICEPVLQAGADGRLGSVMPIHVGADGSPAARDSSPLEAVARSLAGISPWLALPAAAMEADEAAMQSRCRLLALDALRNLPSLDAPDGVDARAAEDPQTLVEAAIIALALLRAQAVLWGGLEAYDQRRLLAWFERTRRIPTHDNNWLLFPAMVETALQVFSGEGQWPPIRRGLRAFRDWYAGDGVYRDGAALQCDYYNSYIIQPMLLVLAKHAGRMRPRPPDERAVLLRRAQRHAEISERLIAPDGAALQCDYYNSYIIQPMLLVLAKHA
ncbi:MAG: DUF2264 domain-containing protein, partial [Comamonadaceae bacterium]